MANHPSDPYNASRPSSSGGSGDSGSSSLTSNGKPAEENLTVPAKMGSDVGNSSTSSSAPPPSTKGGNPFLDPSLVATTIPVSTSPTRSTGGAMVPPGTAVTVTFSEPKAEKAATFSEGKAAPQDTPKKPGVIKHVATSTLAPKWESILNITAFSVCSLLCLIIIGLMGSAKTSTLILIETEAFPMVYSLESVPQAAFIFAIAVILLPVAGAMIALDVFPLVFKKEFYRNSGRLLLFVTLNLFVLSYLLFGASVSVISFKHYEDIGKDWDRDIRFMRNSLGAGICGLIAFFSFFPSLVLLMWRTFSMLQTQSSQGKGR